MSLVSILIVFLIVALAFWLIYKYAPEPLKTPLLWIISIGLVVWVFYALGFMGWLHDARI